MLIQRCLLPSMRQELSCRMTRTIASRYRASDSVKKSTVKFTRNFLPQCFCGISTRVRSRKSSLGEAKWQIQIPTWVVQSLVHPAVCFWACWPSGTRTSSCARSSFRLHVLIRRIQAWGTSAPENEPVSGNDPPSDIRKGCNKRVHHHGSQKRSCNHNKHTGLG